MAGPKSNTFGQEPTRKFKNKILRGMSNFSFSTSICIDIYKRNLSNRRRKKNRKTHQIGGCHNLLCVNDALDFIYT